MIGLPFSSSEQLRYEECSSEISAVQYALIQRHPLLHNNPWFVSRIKQFANDDDEPLAKRWLAAVQSRRQILLNASARLSFVEWLATSEELTRAKMIIFHESIEKCSQIRDVLNASGIPCETHHSELRPIERQRILDRFRSGDIRAIASPQTLDEGVDVPDAMIALIVAGNRSRRQSVQRLGRILRRSSPNKRAKAIFCFIEGATGDPNLGLDEGSFIQEISGLGRSTAFRWPSEGATIQNWLTRELEPPIITTDKRVPHPQR
jgi:RNA polymerase primary sigma factor